MMARLGLSIVMVLALAGAMSGSARADWDDRPDPGEFEESLAPHGYWVDDAQFGHVWRPYVWWGWQPYFYGQWIWTPYGWTWSSYEPWGWTFHYGRWGFSNLYGWVWTPGFVWGPAWVSWFWGDGFVGWAPLGPPGFVVVPTYWSYVPTWGFCSPHVNQVVVAQRRLPPQVLYHQRHGWGVRRAPDLNEIQHVSRHQVVRADHRPRDTVAPWVHKRVERGERVRERVASRGGEQVIEHRGRGPEARERPKVRDDGWRRPGERTAGRDPVIIERGRGRSPFSGGESLGHERSSPFPGPGRFDDDTAPGRKAGRNRDLVIERRGDEPSHSRGGRDGRAWTGPQPQVVIPHGRVESPRGRAEPQVIERGAPSMSHRGGRSAPTLGAGGGMPPARAMPGAPAIQHGQGGGRAAPSSGGWSRGGGGGAGSFGGR
jgi:hypothetical protein